MLEGVPEVRRALLAWYDANARDLPWRRTRDPYAIWVAEVMLQQTRVETVIPYYARFLGRFPDVAALASASIDEVLSAWAGLGYYRRARLLHAGAKHVVETHAGDVPRDAEAIRAIPGVGAYTTGAIGSQAFDLELPIVDGNVARVAARLALIEEDVKRSTGLGKAWRVAEALVRGPRPGALNNALMELGATICVPSNPRCLLCPIRGACKARREGREHELPIVVAKKKTPRIEEVAAILTRGDATVLLGRVRGDGLFGGLWEPPRIARKGDARAALRELLAIEMELEAKSIGRVEHVLTHRVLDVRVHRGSIERLPAANARYDDFAFVSPSGDTRALSTLTRKLLDLTAATTRRKTRGKCSTP